MSPVVEAVARALRPAAWALDEDGRPLFARRLDRADAQRDARTAIMILADAVTIEQVEAACEALYSGTTTPWSAGAYWDEWARKKPREHMRRALSAAIRAALNP